MKPFSLLAASVLLALPALAGATIIKTTLATPIDTTPNSGGGNSNGTGVWFNPLTGYAELRGSTFPSPLFEDGKFFLLQDTSFTVPEAEVFTQGFFSRGNGVIFASTTNKNPARFGDGAVIGPGVGYQNPSDGFADLGPTFGNWVGGGHGYLGLMLRNPAGAGSSNIFYGYAEINVNTDAGLSPPYSITLLSFAYNNVENAPITTPEPTTIAAGSLALAGLARRRK